MSAEDIFTQRLNKAEELQNAGVLPFGERYDGIAPIADTRASYNAEADENEEQPACVAGRLMSRRIMGNAIFADVRDSSERVQLFISKKLIGAEPFKMFKKLLDIGDIIGVKGSLFVTKTGELSIKVAEYKLLSKSLRSLPEKFHGLTNVEQRYRQRYLDLIMNQDSRKVFQQRFEVIREIRKYLETKGYLEVETPMLQPMAGGASANPFKTYYEALSSEMFMRIAPELYLKRLLVGGFEKVYELNRNFRNEGMSRRHNPEFTMIEIYEAYGDCRTMMDLVEEMVTTIAENVFGTLKIEHADGKVIDLTRPWRRAPYHDLVKEKAGDDWFDISHEERVKRAKEMDLFIEDSWPDFEITNEVYEKLIEKTLIQPTFVTRLPAQLVPLAKACPDDESLVDVFELEINGQEIAPGYSELNDPVEQRRRFMEQYERTREEGDNVNEKVDQDFLTALEHGMPPAGGMGIGIDRLVMMLTGAESIRDVVLFPQMRINK
ncbi:MAG: lysine--tRNA ligase [Lentisphaerae bacterium]|nr:lysine--tRNA ligase [Lentisphaerota bacterium]MCP4102481.1 lysine--tRNA ligase [Lentisphaerota bacterium]